MSLYTPVIVKYRDASTDERVQLEDWLYAETPSCLQPTPGITSGCKQTVTEQPAGDAAGNEKRSLPASRRELTVKPEDRPVEAAR